MPAYSSSLVRLRDTPQDQADTSVKDNPTPTKDAFSFTKDNAASTKYGARSQGREGNDAGPVGNEPEIKTLYVVNESGHEFWYEQRPEGLSLVDDCKDMERFAVIHRRRLCKVADSDSPDVIKSHSIVIHSPYLKNSLVPVFQDCPEIDVASSPLQLMAPFNFFVQRWGEFEAARDKEAQHPEAKAHMDLLYDMMKGELKDHLATRERCLRSGMVAYEDLWTIFPPGGCVLCHDNDNGLIDDDEPRYSHRLTAFQVLKGSYAETEDGEKRCYVLDCMFIGMYPHMAWYQTEIEIPRFPADQSIYSLPVRPLELCRHRKELEDGLYERGRKFMKLAKARGPIPYHGEYNGTAIEPSTGGKVEFKGRFIMDASVWETCYPEEHQLPQSAKKVSEKKEHLIFTLPYLPGYLLETNTSGCTSGWLFFYVDLVRQAQPDAEALESPTSIQSCASVWLWGATIWRADI
ncbi:AAA family ATPase, putative [Metarhizium acridum CQMa 102]|uniref:AAA family ATPase, putative n=2 Tax=Metarhizium acridum (strain CQMa 102) TaxID=655827 RepID=E9E2H6_METAQ|nr:AAA family ATPase, putative [Metarhizium acridum CQMa 102]EFY89865.1 AAA family ATPase, putative [Metarhizium acridum CQMa 102]